LDHNDVTWDGSKGGKFWRIKKVEKDKIWSFKKRIGRVGGIVIENH
jgi:hypothetical protein